MTRQQRRQWITDRLRAGPVASQEDLARMLARRGGRVTQATISRDLRAIGALKGSCGYYLPETFAVPPDQGDDGADLAPVLKRCVVSAGPADSLVIVRTPPGHAAMLAAALDRWPPPRALGTIAGDDTVFIATAGRGDAARLVTTLRRGAGLDRRSRSA